MASDEDGTLAGLMKKPSMHVDARAYDAAANEHFGEFANLNFKV